MPTAGRVAVEAVVVGVLLALVGLVVSLIFAKLTGRMAEYNAARTGWNRNHAMEWALFFTGAAFHVAAEVTGMNRWYVQHYR